MGISQLTSMSTIFLNFGVFALALAVSAATVPLMIGLARKWNLFDIPEGDALKIHKERIPYLGGFALFLGVVVSVALFSIVWGIRSMEAAGIFSAALLLFGLGFWDDVKWKHISQVRPYVKFGLLILVPVFAATLLVLSGLTVGVGESVVAIPLVAFYIFVFVNALNYQDGMDGLAGTLSAISFGAFAFVGFMTGDALVMGLSLALLGAVLGFLFFNFPPARIFMGDSGAYFLGFSLAVLALLVSDFHAIQGILGPILLFGAPLFEGLFTNVRRLVQGQSIFKGDRNHTYDRLLQHGYSTKKVLVLFSLVQLISVVFGVLLLL